MVLWLFRAAFFFVPAHTHTNTLAHCIFLNFQVYITIYLEEPGGLPSPTRINLEER